MDNVASLKLSRRCIVKSWTLPFIAETSLNFTNNKEILSAPDLCEAAEMSVKNTIVEGFTDVFDQPNEYMILKSDRETRNQVIAYVSEILRAVDVGVIDRTSIEYFAFQKGRYGSRRTCSAIEPLASIYFLALSIMIAHRIEASRPNDGWGAAFSYRYRPMAGKLFDKQFSYSSFRRLRTVRENESRYIVRTDIENFYDSISIDQLRNSLVNCGCDELIVSKIVRLIHTWTNGRGGLPVGSNASRILAEAVLIDIDRRLSSEKIKYLRYVDDFSLLFMDESSANIGLEFISNTFEALGLKLNKSKTKIVALDSGKGIILEEGIPGVSRKKKVIPPPASETPQIPMKFREPRRGELPHLFALDLSKVSEEFAGTAEIPPWKVRRVIRSIIVQGDDVYSHLIPEIVSRYPEFASYIASALISNSVRFTKSFAECVSAGFSDLVGNHSLPPFAEIRLLRVLSTPPFVNRPAIIGLVGKAAEKRSGIYTREILMALRATGGASAETLRAFSEVDLWTKRELAASSDKSSMQYLRNIGDKLDPFSVFILKKVFKNSTV